MSILTSIQTPGNVMAGGITAAAIFNALPTILGIIAGVLGVAWYCVLFYDRFKKGPKADAE